MPPLEPVAGPMPGGDFSGVMAFLDPRFRIPRKRRGRFFGAERSRRKKSEALREMAYIDVVRGDITTLDVDAIVNAANETLLGGGGVDGAIHAAAGPRLLAACRAIPEVAPNVRCPTGEARLTPGFDLPARFVIHTVGPVWRGGGHDEAALLASAYRTSLEVAVANEVRSIAFPAISCGVYGYPLAEAARIATTTIADFLAEDETLEQVLLVGYGEDVARAFERAALEGGR